MMKSKINFRSITFTDIPLMLQWFNTPHIQEFYSPRSWTEDEVLAKLTPYISGDKPVSGFMVLLEENPIGYLQSYKVSDYPWPNQNLPEEIVKTAVGMDLFIGNKDFLGKGGLLMRKILLISDTHGNLDIINEKVNQTQADMVIHAGDFGFYDEQSIYRLSQRELRLLVSHSPIWRQYEVDKQTNRERLIEIVKEHQLLGDFPDYISGKKKFLVPVYAVWGNHEDVQVLRQLKATLCVENLHVLDEHHFYQFHTRENDLEFSLYGLGGNFLVSKKLFDKPIAGNGGKVWTALHQFGALYQQIKNKSKPSIFVSHVSPGKEPLLSRLIMYFMPNFWISGHMGAPFTCTWNQFTIREMNESLNWLESDIDLIEEQYQQGRLTDEAALAYEIIKRPIDRDESWYKKLWNINLPDVVDGHALLILKENRFSLETYSNGIKFNN